MSRFIDSLEDKDSRIEIREDEDTRESILKYTDKNTDMYINIHYPVDTPVRDILKNFENWWYHKNRKHLGLLQAQILDSVHIDNLICEVAYIPTDEETILQYWEETPLGFECIFTESLCDDNPYDRVDCDEIMSGAYEKMWKFKQYTYEELKEKSVEVKI